MDKQMPNEKKEVKKILSADEIAEIMDVEYATVTGWGGHPIRLQSLTAGDMIDFAEAQDANKEVKRVAGIRLIIKSAIFEDGRPVFTDKHTGMLREKNHRITHNIVKAILKLNGMETKEKGKNTDAEEDAKND